MSEFYRRARSRSGYMSECKACHNTWQRDNYDKKRVIAARHRKTMREQALQALGGRCARCALDDVRVLQIDHVNGGGGLEKRTIGDLGVQRRVIRGEPGYQALCANCHAIKTWHD